MTYYSLAYLQAGSPRQQRAYATLAATGLWPLLRAYGPVLAGTVPLGIDTKASDLDVLCEVPAAAQDEFAGLLRAHFGTRPGFRLVQRMVGGHAATVASFGYEAEEIEVFGQVLPTAQQHGWRHLLVEAAVLAARPGARPCAPSKRRASKPNRPLPSCLAYPATLTQRCSRWRGCRPTNCAAGWQPGRCPSPHPARGRVP